jgi:uncharacterized iron-regulated protein
MLPVVSRARVAVVSLMTLLLACSKSAPPPRTASPELSPDIRLHGRVVSEDAIVSAARAADIVYLGEKHDNPEHHRLQAHVLLAIVHAGAKPAVVFEMIDDDHQAVLDALAARANPTPADYRDALAWDKSGWPSFDLYEPIFRVAIDNHLPIIAGNAPSALVKHVAFTGEGAENLSALPAPAEKDLEDELEASHCGALPAEALPAMALAQRVRDARLAEHARNALKTSVPRAVVILGNGHARIDRGAPWAATQLDPSLRQLSISFEETGRDADPSPPYDVVWMTAATPEVDHCKEFLAHHPR